MRILITGGCGYLGGRLAQFLATEAGHELVLGSRRASDPPRWLPQATVTQTHWESPTQLEQVCAGVDAVVHLARMNAQECASDPIAALEFNGVATARLLAAAVRQRVTRFIYLSTAHVYANSLAGVITEETCPVSLHPYATSNRAGEDVVRAAHQRGAIEGIVIRLSNAFGAPAHKDANCWMLLINDLCRQAVTSRRIVLRSTGLQRRDFVPMTDACRAIGRLLRVPEQDLAKNVVNVGGEWAPTVWEVACLVQERCAIVLGGRPELTRLLPAIGVTSTDLEYRLDILRQAGVRPTADRGAEIDSLLEFCNAAFA